MTQLQSISATNRHEYLNRRYSKVAVLLTEQFSLLSLTSLTDVLDMVQVASSVHYVDVSLHTLSGDTIRSRSGVKVVPDCSLSDGFPRKGQVPKPDMYFICSGKKLSQNEADSILALVRRCRVSAIPVCVIGAAIPLIAQSGHLSKGTDHWSRIPVNRETCPNVEFQECIFVRDGKLVSCSGELGAMDFALHWVEANICAKAAAWIRSHLLLQSVRSAGRKQTCTTADRYRGIPKKLEHAIELMLDHMEELLPIQEIADRVGMSTRQLERLFKQELNTSPLKFYRAQQLDLGWRLIEDTNMQISEISVACGFMSTSSFATLFKDKFGQTPMAFRKSRAQSPV